jgi:1-deoxy-D-xylulose-5-phosphate reductoisomerase
LTASGGPFFGKTTAQLQSVTAADALKHPNWDMGAKITIDSATMMNKGLELIEARWLFDMPAEKIDIVVHRESIVHSLVEYDDNAVLAQLGLPDMRIPIQYALTYPARTDGLTPPLDLFSLGGLTFERPDTEAFPLLALAYSAIRQGGALPAVLNAANEVAVAAFLQKEIPFHFISEAVGETAARLSRASECRTLDGILSADKEAREVARSLLFERGFCPKGL